MVFLGDEGDLAAQPVNGSQRSARNDYVLPADVVNGWGAAPGKLDPERDLIGDFVSAGFAYAPDNTALNAACLLYTSRCV